jgi:hypothetical protein
MPFPIWVRKIREKASGAGERLLQRVTLGLGIFTLAASPTSAGEPRVPVNAVPAFVPDAEVKKFGGKYVLKRAKAALQVVFAQHRSHSSHSSHRSHSSHASHSSGTHYSHYSATAVPAPAPRPASPPPAVAAPPASPRTPPKILVDTFGDNAPSAETWRTAVLIHPLSTHDRQVEIRETGGRLEIKPRELVDGPHFNGYVSRQQFDMRIGVLSVEVADIPNENATATFAIAEDATNWYGFTASGGELHCIAVVNGERSEKRLGYDSKQHRYWRLRLSGIADLFIWETSSDGVTWKVQYRVPSELPLGTVAVVIEAGSERPADFPGKAIFDNVVLAAR